MELKTLTGTHGSGDGGTPDRTCWLNYIVSASAHGGSTKYKGGQWYRVGRLLKNELHDGNLSSLTVSYWGKEANSYSLWIFFEVSTPIFGAVNLFALIVVSKVLQSISGAADITCQLLSQWHPHGITCLSWAKQTFHSHSSVFPLDQRFVLFLLTFLSLLFKHQLCSRSSLLNDLKCRPVCSDVIHIR